MPDWIWIKSRHNYRKYYHYGDYSTYKKAEEEAKKYAPKRGRKNRKKNRSFIIKTEKGWVFPRTTYQLYFTHICKITYIPDGEIKIK